MRTSNINQICYIEYLLEKFNEEIKEIKEKSSIYDEDYFYDEDKQDK